MLLLSPDPRFVVKRQILCSDSLRGMQDCIKTDLRGKTSTLQQLYIRGNQIVFCIVPNMLRNAPMFARIKQWRKYKGHPPVLASEGAKGQRAAIMRKGGIQKRGYESIARRVFLFRVLSPQRMLGTYSG